MPIQLALEEHPLSILGITPSIDETVIESGLVAMELVGASATRHVVGDPSGLDVATGRLPLALVLVLDLALSFSYAVLGLDFDWRPSSSATPPLLECVVLVVFHWVAQANSLSVDANQSNACCEKAEFP